MELPIEFQNKANALESKWANTPHKYEGIQQADGYEQGALDMLKAVEAMLNNMLQDLYTPEEKEGIKDVLKYLHTVKPL
jgi:hypothetical protein